MVRDRTAIRADLDYLRRRRKPAETPPPVTPAAAAAGATLSLGNRAPAAASSAGTRAPAASLNLGSRAPAAASSAGSQPGAGLNLQPASSRPAPAARSSVAAPNRAFPAPGFGDLRQLDGAHPVARLNARQSAIGSLLVTGVRAVAWEGEDFTTGAHHSHGHTAGAAVRTPGNRPLVGIQDSAGVVSLRHVQLLRRALFIAGETPLTIGVFDGAAAAVPAVDDDGQRSVLYISRIGAVLELRAEFVPAEASDAAIWEIFGFTMTIPLDQHVLPR
ncbi:MAG: hypothetical protein ABIO34_00740 [Arthrobacter oryzae]